MTSIPTERIPRPVLELAATLAERGERAWIVGGCLRDTLLGRAVSDWDLATTAKPERVVQIFPRTIPTGIAHGTVTVMHRGVGYEVTTLRGEGAYTDGRHPDSVFFVDDITRDLERRDFTVNAIALDLETMAVVDPFEGRKDLADRVIRAVRDPMLRFSEDGLRVLRAARFSASLEFRIDDATLDAIRPTLTVLAKVSRERVRDEWMKTMKAREPSRAFRVMRETGILEVVGKPLAEADASAFDAAMQSMDRAKGAIVRHAALLSCLGFGEASSRVAERLLTELRYSNDERKSTSELLRFGAPAPRAGLDRVSVRRVLRSVGRARMDDWLAFLEATRESADVDAWRASVREEMDAGMVFDAKELAIRGDAIAPLVGGPGPRIKGVLESLMTYVEEDPSRNRAELLIERARTFASEIASG